jgi:hypothetical protein
MERSFIENNKCFPICHLTDNVLLMLESLGSIDWLNISSEGLDKNIILDDFYGPITDIANLDSLDRIHLSLAYCQFLWSLCYVASKTYDCNNVQQAIEDLTSDEIEQFKNELVIGKNEDVVKELTQYLVPTDVFKKCHIIFEKGASLIKNSVEFSGFNQYYEVTNVLDAENFKVNSIYCYAVVFILCHEIGHFSLKHPNLTTKDDEEGADSYSFWTLYSDASAEAKISAMIGALSGLCSLLFFSKDLIGDEQHPNEDDRIMAGLSIIQDEYPHYTGFVLQLFKMWAYYFEIKDFPDSSQYSTHEDALVAVLSYVENKRRSI